MSVIEELEKKKQLKSVTFSPLNIPENTFVSLDVVLKPVDFYQLLEVVELAKPLIIQILQDFGIKLLPNLVTQKILKKFLNMTSCLKQ